MVSRLMNLVYTFMVSTSHLIPCDGPLTREKTTEFYNTVHRVTSFLLNQSNHLILIGD